MKNEIIYYSVGALMYCPANNESIVKSITTEKFGRHYSLALCLEDTINDCFVEDAEEKLIRSLKTIYTESKTKDFFIPKIFIRVRIYSQIQDLMARLGDAQLLVCGFIIPKFIPENADKYIEAVCKANIDYNRTIYFMPILESSSMVNLKDRYNILYSLKEKLGRVERLVLNVRVGGNDLSNVFGFRRKNDETIYSYKPISSIFSDIITVFGRDYVVSGPVWEYFSGVGWSEGLKKELHEDRMCGFIGKTVIHPNQIEVVYSSLKVSKKDLEDATSILNWSKDNQSLVSGSQAKERMNEYKTHYHWAKKIRMLYEVYGLE